MPTVLRIGGYRFFFYSSDSQEPPHIHVECGNAKVKYWLNPVRFERSNGFGSVELNRIQRLVERHVGQLRRNWDEFFGG